jgi:DNA-binding transcriptional MerR regulator
MLSAMGELLSIGRFGKEAQLTPRQLRYYHARGLLIPAAVDPHSGYRYYAEAQLASAELIALLRSVDMPVAEIQLLLTDRSPANTGAVFERLRASVERSLERAREGRLFQAQAELLGRTGGPEFRAWLVGRHALHTHPRAGRRLAMDSGGGGRFLPAGRLTAVPLREAKS